MTNQEVIKTLKNEADHNPTAKAVFLVLGLRERTRPTLSVQALSHAMREQGFSHDAKEYVKIIKLLAELGFGELMVGRRGAVKGITNINTKLKSIGAAAIDKGETFEPFRSKKVYQDLVPHRAPTTVLPARRRSSTVIRDSIRSFFKSIGRFFIRISGTDLPKEQLH